MFDPSSENNGTPRRSLLRRMLSGGLFVGAGALFGRAASAQAAPQTAPAVLRNPGISVSDLERSVLFYTEVLGFKANSKPSKGGASLKAALEIEGDLEVNLQFLDKDNYRLELIEFKTPRPIGVGERPPMNRVGYTHLAFKVTDFDAMCNAVTHMGGKVLENTRLKGPDGKTRLIFVTDPDGTRIEFVPA